MAISALQALLNPALDPPPEPPPPKPGITAFQRRLAEQRAAARNAPDPTPDRTRPSDPGRAPRQAPPGPQAGEREARAGASPERQLAPSQGAFVASGFDGAWSGNGGGGGGAGQGNLGGAGMAGAAPEAGFDCELLLGLLPGDGDSGIFELLLPGGERLGVVADISRRQANFLLTPSSERLRQQINKAKMELEKGLAQRMDRHVRLTVL